MNTPAALRNGQVLIAVFAVLAVIAGAVTVLATGGGSRELFYALAGGIIAATVIIGMYVWGLRYGQPHSHAVAVAGVTFGMVVTLGIVAELLYASDRLTSGEMGLVIGGGALTIIVLIGLLNLLDRVISPS